MKISYILTAPESAWAFLAGQLRFLAARGHEVRLYTAPGPLLAKTAEREGVAAQALPLEREIAPLKDLRALWATWLALRANHPDIVNVGTPKAGLIGGLAAVLARVPRRIYVLHGLRLETETGARRILLTALERLACACAQDVICVSESLRQQVIARKLAPAHKLQVLGAGSANGVDWATYARRLPAAERAQQRAALGIPPEAKVIGFVGRLTRDKGVCELIEAFETLCRSRSDELRLLLLGYFEDGDPVPPHVRRRIEEGGTIIWAGRKDPRDFYPLMDVLALPTHREGLGMVAIEASAAGLPVVGTTATGIRDAVRDGVTGKLVQVGDATALAAAIAALLDDPARARVMGEAGSDWVRDAFEPERIWALLEDIYTSAPPR